MSKADENKEGGFYVVEAVDISSESDPDEIDDVDDIEEIKVDDQELNDLDKLIAATKSKDLRLKFYIIKRKR
jgi:hypothetical protein